MPWWLAAIAGASTVALGGWLLLSGAVVSVWLGAMSGSFIDAVSTGTRVWLLAHGCVIEIGALRVSLVPLGLTLLVAVMLGQAAAFATRQSLTAESSDLRLSATPATWKPALLLTACYTGIVAVAASLFVTPVEAGWTLIVTASVALLATLWGSWSVTCLDVTAGWPAWTRRLPRAALAGAGVVFAVALAALVGTLIVHGHEMMTLQRALKPGAVGIVALIVLDLAYAPTLLLWASAYVLGGGFALGPDATVSIANTHLGMLPGIPIMGALPTSSGHWYLYLWLIGGALAGVVAAWFAVRDRESAGIDELALSGAVAGILAALVVVGCATLSRGSLGLHRLAGMGPRLGELATLSTSLLGIAGAATGAVIGLLRTRIPAESTPAEDVE
ncbi:MAG: cell division protein PerM [Propionibacteriaceae bacterium]